MARHASTVEVIDPTDSPGSAPTEGLGRQVVLEVGGYRLDRDRVSARTGWLRADGPRYGWVRSGSGWLEDRTDRVELSAGAFVRVPTGAHHRFVAVEPLELLVVTAPAVAAAGASARPIVVPPDALAPAVESPNLRRETPFPDAEDGVLLLRVRAEGGSRAGWHHHGENVYFGHAVDGPSETEYDGGVARIEAGECFHVPPGLVHRDTNPGAVAHTGVVWLCGGEPWVVNVDTPA
jgi:mannose-6-phosphate isomerase-like protein (cupin superfamily)